MWPSKAVANKQDTKVPHPLCGVQTEGQVVMVDSSTTTKCDVCGEYDCRCGWDDFDDSQDDEEEVDE
jgi:hypothetical protein